MFWGATFLIVRLAMQYSGPLFFVGMRFIVAGLITSWVFRRSMAGLAWAEIRAGIAIGSAVFLGYSLQTAGLQTITASKSAFITAMYVPAVPLLQWLVLGVCLDGFVLPLLAVLDGLLGGGFAALLARPMFWIASATSIGIASASALLTLGLALGLAMGRAASARASLRLALAVPAYTYLAVPAMVLALGFFLLVRGFGIAPERAGPPVVILANALLSLPFAIATLGPPLEAIARGDVRLIRSLGLGGWRQFAAIEWPLLGRDIGVVLALAFCFSLGDLGIISLFGSTSFTTLPLLLVEALGAYRTNDAGVIAALMLGLTIVAFVALPPLLERLSRARA